MHTDIQNTAYDDVKLRELLKSVFAKYLKVAQQVTAVPRVADGKSSTSNNHQLRLWSHQRRLRISSCAHRGLNTQRENQALTKSVSFVCSYGYYTEHALAADRRCDTGTAKKMEYFEDTLMVVKSLKCFVQLIYLFRYLFKTSTCVYDANCSFG